MKNEDEVSSGNWCHLWRDSQGGVRAVPTVCPCLETGLWVCAVIRNNSEHPDCRGADSEEGNGGTLQK